jgi:cytochrome c oxidase assembly factor CtaG
MFPKINGVMKIVISIVILLISAILGIIIRILTKNKPKTEFLIWVILMTFWLGFLIYGLVLILNQENPLFSRNNLSNEIAVIVSILFLISGFMYYRKKRDYLLGKNVKN